MQAQLTLLLVPVDHFDCPCVQPACGLSRLCALAQVLMAQHGAHAVLTDLVFGEPADGRRPVNLLCAQCTSLRPMEVTPHLEADQALACGSSTHKDDINCLPVQPPCRLGKPCVLAQVCKLEVVHLQL